MASGTLVRESLHTDSNLADHFQTEIIMAVLLVITTKYIRYRGKRRLALWMGCAGAGYLRSASAGIGFHHYSYFGYDGSNQVIPAFGGFIGGSYFVKPNFGFNAEAGFDITDFQVGGFSKFNSPFPPR